MPANFIAAWNGSSWSALGSGVNNPVGALAVDGSTLYAGGWFATAGGHPSVSLGIWWPSGIPTSTPTPPRATVTPLPPSATATPTSPPTQAPTNTPLVASPTPVPPSATSTAPPPTVPATRTPTPISFSDVQPSDYFYAPVMYLAARGAISGYADGTFRPYANTTRAQMVNIVVLGFTKPITTPASGYTFADVPAAFPFYAVIETAATGQIVSGYACGGPGEACDDARRPYFRPYANVTRGQLAKIVVGAAGWPLLNPASPTFTDVVPGSAFYRFVETAVCHGVISGYADHTFHPGANATRGQISKVVYLSITGTRSCNPAAGK